jgi:hypothetical protein
MLARRPSGGFTEPFIEWSAFNADGNAAMCNGPEPPDPAHCTTDCQVSEWSACSVGCGYGIQSRIVTVPPTNGGAACPDLRRPCSGPPCKSVDCAVSDWSECSARGAAECELDGTQTRFVTTKPVWGGKACPPLVRPCKGPTCAAVDCKVSGWGACSASCGSGTRTRNVLVRPAHGGAACPALSQSCNEQPCYSDDSSTSFPPSSSSSSASAAPAAPAAAPAVDCQVSGWSGCSASCGGGTQTRTVTAQAQNGGKACPPLSQQCNAQPCPQPVDCQVSGWSGCSASCGGGTQTRSVMLNASNGGAACPPLRQQCNTQACASPIGGSPCDQSCAYWGWGISGMRWTGRMQGGNCECGGPGSGVIQPNVCQMYPSTCRANGWPG